MRVIKCSAEIIEVTYSRSIGKEYRFLGYKCFVLTFIIVNVSAMLQYSDDIVLLTSVFPYTESCMYRLRWKKHHFIYGTKNLTRSYIVYRLRVSLAQIN